MATTSSGLTPLDGALPKNSSTIVCTFGILVMPPTRRTSSISDLLNPESLTHFLQGSKVHWMRPSTRDSNCDCVIFKFKWLGPLASAVMNGSDVSLLQSIQLSLGFLGLLSNAAWQD